MRTFEIQYMYAGKEKMSRVEKIRAPHRHYAMNVILMNNKPKILKNEIDYFTLKEKGIQDKSTILISTKLRDESSPLWRSVQYSLDNTDNRWFHAWN